MGKLASKNLKKAANGKTSNGKTHNVKAYKVKSNGGKVSMLDVAQAAGVGTTAVSYALNGKGNLSAATRETIVRVARELGYEGNYFAQNLKLAFREVVALCACIDLGVGTVKIWEIQHRLDRAGYAVETHITPVYMSHESQQQVDMLRTVRRLKPRAIICEVSTMRAGLEAGGYDELQRYMESGGILLCYNALPTQSDLEGDLDASENAVANAENQILNCDTVFYDEAHSAYLMGRHLLEMGHRDLSFCIHGHNPTLEHPHARGFVRALEEAEIEPNWNWIWGECCQEDGGARLAERFLAMPRAQWPTAVGVINDVMASSFVNAMARAGFKIPDDLSVISHDDVPAAKNCLVPLSTISHPSAEIAAQLVEMLLERLESGYDGAARRVTVRGELVQRDSVRPFKTSSSSPAQTSRARTSRKTPIA